jgi:hypothetical protein
MLTSSLSKYGFRIRTRGGGVVDNLLIFGRDEAEAERKLRQIYFGCEILAVKRLALQVQRNQIVNYEDVVDLISGAAAVGK